ncbi:MAG: acyltransferase family protein [Porphyrobacter sp.]|nr:acyltransferase family protein [Porphyrobacter sp.]
MIEGELERPVNGPARSAQGKLAAIQLLRIVAASVVAVLHVALAFADHVGEGLGIGRETGPADQMAVMLFFLVSGYVMVISSRGRFGRSGARWSFWRRRLIRIMPAYWIASLALAGVFLTIQPRPVDPAALLRSLALVPYWPPDGGLRPLPFLWVGWTLFYEMCFYAVFGLFIALRKTAALGATAAALLALVLAGFAVPPENAFLFAVTRPVLLMFLAGMGIALWRGGGGAASGRLRVAALLAMCAALALIPEPAMPEAMGFDYLAWCGLPALLLALAVLGGPLALPAPRAVVAAGDMSYALYLLHLPIAWAWLWLWARLPFFDPGPWDYLVSALLATWAASWLFFVHVERPMTAGLNRLARSPHGGRVTA